VTGSTVYASGVLPFAVDALAAYRLTRLVVDDSILDGPRGRMLGRLDEPTGPAWALKLGEGLRCYWCVGMWAAAAVTAARWAAETPWRPTSWLLAVSAAAGLIAQWEINR